MQEGRKRSEARRGTTRGTEDSEIQALIISEVELLLSEKRTSLAALRTGIAILISPLTLFTILVATSRYYDILSVLPLVATITVGSILLFATGTYVLIRSFRHIGHYDEKIRQLKAKNPVLRDLLDVD